MRILKEKGALNISTNKSNSKQTKVYIKKEAIKVSNDSRRTNNKNNSEQLETSTTYLIIGADDFKDLKEIDWNWWKEIFADNNPDTMVTIEFSYNNPILLKSSKVDSFNHKIHCKTSELASYLKKSKKIIEKLSPIN